MLGETKPGMQCAEFDALLSDAIDGVLSSEQRQRFEEHKSGCEACSALFAEVSSGMGWLRELDEVEPPQNLIHNILATTSSNALQDNLAEPRVTRWERLRQRLGMIFAPVLTPRFGMSMGMAFFSITLVLNMAQIRITDLTPHNLSHTFYSSQNKLMKYYENMRLVYEIESRVRDIRNTSDDDGREERNRPRERNKSRTQEQNQNSAPDWHLRREYSWGQGLPLLARLNEGTEYLGMIALQRRNS